MGKQAFTPGPWEVREHEFEGLCVHAPTVEARTACEYRIAENVNGDSTARPKYGTPEANAHLIAAAPEMYEALIAVRKLGMGKLGRNQVLNIVDAALAKAVTP